MLKIQNQLTLITLKVTTLVTPILGFLTVWLTNSPAIAVSLGDGLQGYWQFNGNGKDSSSNGRNLNIVGGAGFSPGLFEQALSLTGDPNQFAVRPIDDSVFNFGSEDFTIQVWSNFNTTDNEQVQIEKFVGGDGPGWFLTKLSNNAFRFGACTGSFLCIPGVGDLAFDTPSLSISTGVFHQIIVRREGNVFSIFFDGNLVASDSFGVIPDTTNPLLIGKRNPADPSGFGVNGLMDEVAIWNRAISDEDIKNIYNDGAGKPIEQAQSIPEPRSFLGYITLVCLMLREAIRKRELLKIEYIQT